jgi:UMF1 family MFS transporter
MTGGLYFIGKGHWQMAVLAYALATIGFSGANIFYDSLIKLLSHDEHELDRISALGFAMGYLGGGILFALNVLMTLKPQFFFLTDTSMAVRVSFILVALWWAVFSIPLMINVKEPRGSNNQSIFNLVKTSFGDLGHTFQEIRALKHTFYFLLSYWLYIDGVDTIIRMAVDYGMSLGFASNDLIIALLITQFVGFPAAIAFGHLATRFGAKMGIFLAIAVYILITIWGYFMKSAWEFYFLAVAIGLVQGGIQALSRSLYARLIPAKNSAQFFGFYNMMGKFAAVIGPALMGWVALTTGSTRTSILSVNVLFILGGLLLLKVNVKEGQLAVKGR